jgi:hypothetical protein
MTGGCCHSTRVLLCSLSCQEQISCVLESGENQSGLSVRAGAALRLAVARYWQAALAPARSWPFRMWARASVRPTSPAYPVGLPHGMPLFTARRIQTRPPADPWPPRCTRHRGRGLRGRGLRGRRLRERRLRGRRLRGRSRSPQGSRLPRSPHRTRPSRRWLPWTWCTAGPG